MPKEKIMSHNALTNQALVEFAKTVPNGENFNADFWVAVRNRRHGTTHTINRGPHKEIVHGLNSSKKAARIQEKRLERLSRRGLQNAALDENAHVIHGAFHESVVEKTEVSPHIRNNLKSYLDILIRSHP